MQPFLVHLTSGRFVRGLINSSKILAATRGLQMLIDTFCINIRTRCAWKLQVDIDLRAVIREPTLTRCAYRPGRSRRILSNYLRRLRRANASRAHITSSPTNALPLSLLSRLLPSFADGIHSRQAIKHLAWNLIGARITRVHIHMRLTRAAQKPLICHFPENIPRRNNKLQRMLLLLFFFCVIKSSVLNAWN